jgi:hypothetical protein
VAESAWLDGGLLVRREALEWTWVTCDVMDVVSSATKIIFDTTQSRIDVLSRIGNACCCVSAYRVVKVLTSLRVLATIPKQGEHL